MTAGATCMITAIADMKVARWRTLLPTAAAASMVESGEPHNSFLRTERDLRNL
jgi:hypothetical protein